MNPYISYLEPYQFAKTTQGTALQDQYNAQALQQMGQLAAQAGQTPQTSGNSSALSMANALRNMNKTQWSPQQISEVNQLGSGFYPWSDYMTGKNGWGNYGE